MSSNVSADKEASKISRRAILALGAAAITAGTGVVLEQKVRAVREVADMLAANTRVESIEARLLRKVDTLALVDESGLPQQVREILANFKRTDPVGYRSLMAQVEHHERNPRANVLDYLGTAVFAHGVSQIIDTNIGHVGVEPYAELAAVLAVKYITGNEKAREHLRHELLENQVMTLAVLGLVTLGENTGVHMDLFQKRIKAALDSDTTRNQVNVIEHKSKQAVVTLQAFKEKLSKAITPERSLTECIQLAREDPELQLPEQKRVIKWFIEKELWVALVAAYYQQASQHLPVQNVLRAKPGSLTPDQEQFCKGWLVAETQHIVAQVVDRFGTKENIRETIELGSGSALFASAASPVVTTVAAASVVRKAGIGRRLAGKPIPGYAADNAVPMAMSGIPPFQYRIQNLLEDHVSNLSGLGGIGDPPFIAMMQKFGLKGFVAQMVATWPATAMNAEMSYAGLLQEYYPFLTFAEAHKMAVEHFVRLVPEYFRLLACNIVNVFCALVGGALSLGAGLGKLLSPAIWKKVKDNGFAEMIFAEGPMQRWQKKRATAGKKTSFRLAEGVQFSLGVMAYEVIDELMITEKPSLENITALVEKLETKLSNILANIQPAEAGGAVQESTIDTNSTLAERAEVQALQDHFYSVNAELKRLWQINTDATSAVGLLEQIDELKEKRAATNEPDERGDITLQIHQLTARMHELIRQRREVNATPQSRIERGKNVQRFVQHRDAVKLKLQAINDIAAQLDDAHLKRQARFVVQQANTKLMTLELSQLRLIESFKADPLQATKTVVGGTFEMEHMKAIFGSTRAEVLNTLPFQSGCVPMLRPVFQEGLNLLPESMHVLYIIMLFTAFNLFSTGADNLVATLVGLGIKESLWPYILQAAITGGANSRIGNMANLAGCSMEEFPLKASLCWYFIKKHALKAGVNLAYAAVLDQVVIPHFPLLQLRSEEAEQHLALLQTEREKEIALAQSFRGRVSKAIRRTPNPAADFVARQRKQAGAILKQASLADAA